MHTTWPGLYFSEIANQARLTLANVTRNVTTVKGATLLLELTLENALFRLVEILKSQLITKFTVYAD